MAVFERPKLLEYRPSAVDAGVLEHTEPWKRYGIGRQNQLVDSIAQANPVVYQDG